MTPALRMILLNKLGPELAPPLLSANWAVSGNDATHVATFAGSTLRYQSDTTSPQLVVQAIILTIGKRYRVRIFTNAYTSGSLKTDSLGGNTVLVTAAGMSEVIGTASSTALQLTRNSINVDLTMSTVSVREYHGA